MPSAPRRLQKWTAGRSTPLSPEQREARRRWQSRFNLPIIVAALLPLFITSSQSPVTAIVVGVGSWLVFVVDLYVERRIDHEYLLRAAGRFDALIVVLTFPYYLIPGVSGGTAILLLARLGRVARVLLATGGLRRFAARLGKVAAIAAVMLVAGSLAAYEAEHATNPGFATVGDALWWGIVTLTTVGYGDIVPHTRAGRLAGVAIMFAGVGVLGVLAGACRVLPSLKRVRQWGARAGGAFRRAAYDLADTASVDRGRTRRSRRSGAFRDRRVGRGRGASPVSLRVVPS